MVGITIGKYYLSQDGAKVAFLLCVCGILAFEKELESGVAVFGILRRGNTCEIRELLDGLGGFVQIVKFGEFGFDRRQLLVRSLIDFLLASPSFLEGDVVVLAFLIVELDVKLWLLVLALLEEAAIVTTVGFYIACVDAGRTVVVLRMRLK